MHARVSTAIILYMDARDVVRFLGGPVEIGRHLAVRPQAVSLWTTQNQIPLARVPALLALARQQGLRLRAHDIRPDFDWSAVCEGCA
jgi:DNA-binding transcriptional regulator YdaS (Cro superfamily)